MTTIFIIIGVAWCVARFFDILDLIEGVAD